MVRLIICRKCIPHLYNTFQNGHKILQALMDNTTQEVEDFLRTHNIPFKALNHLPITTCEEGLKIAKEFGSTCCKTLLVKNKKQFFLFVIPGEERFNAKQAAAFLKSSHLSFASPEDLSRLMHTFPGAVSLLGLIFDQNKEISLYIDSRILNAEHIDCHPCTNDRSLILSVKDVLEKFLPSLGVSYFEFQSGSLNGESK
ncbi:YbaK/proline--tRNA ligase associated domain protein [Parasutterella excrementihominis YIT 11859]|uniref:YbaK/proline--tRNA ligase associated domain protein n=9 Tax=Parasutterella TaxID=577310 RepID=F3QJH2_9BURK|nr:YbaK/proline--tRNA ligase associated domain protein [Parasutterella excrementihominis YIT 11859]